MPLLGWWERRSLRVRLTAAATVVFTIALVCGGVLLANRLQRSLLDSIDRAARQRAQDVVAIIAAGSVTEPIATLTDVEGVVQAVAPTGAIIAGTANAAGRARLFDFAPSGNRTVRTISGLSLGDDTGGTYRVAVAAVDRPDGRYLVYAGLPTDDLQDTVQTLTSALAVGTPVVVAILVGMTWFLVGRALGPVETLRRQAAEITATDLDRRVDIPPRDDELSRLASTLNDMLARLDTSMRQQRRFIADAAHELRSPVAALLAQLELRERQGNSAADAELAANARRLSLLVDDLLALARLDAQPPAREELVDLDDIVFDQVAQERLAQLRRHATVAVDTSGVSAAQVRGDAAMLARVVRNLIDNAVRHARSTVRISLVNTRGQATLTVADDGPGIPEQDRHRVFERFTRLDDARSRGTGGVGLGLAIIHDVVTAHGGQVQIEDNQPGARLIVRLPAPGLRTTPRATSLGSPA